MMTPWPESEIRSIALERFDERFRRYRLSAADLHRGMEASLRRYGQISPLVVCQLEEALVLIDGFKRLEAARGIKGIVRLEARRIAVDERAAKAAIYTLNRTGRQPQELEEAWIVQALVREDGLSQVEAASLLGHHKSWVSRRLALLEKLCPEAREDLRLGLLPPSMARQLTRLPAGNQADVLACARRESLTADELRGAVDLLLASGTREKRAYVLEKPREAVQQARGVQLPAWDPRLSSAGNRVSKDLGRLLDQLSRMENWLRHHARGALLLCDRRILQEGFGRLAREGRQVAELAEDFMSEL